jgi:hypothetical protein
MDAVRLRGEWLRRREVQKNRLMPCGQEECCLAKRKGEILTEEERDPVRDRQKGDGWGRTRE